MADEKKSEEQYYLPPPKLSKWEGFKQFMWNSERREFMGRTASSWGKVGLFYLIFYAGLAAFFAVMLVIFYQTLDNFEPKWQMERSVIGVNPGLGFRPMPPETNIESTLIWFKHGDSAGEWDYYKDSLDAFLLHYESGRQDGQHFKDCKNEEHAGTKSCFFTPDYDKWGPCKSADAYGFRDGTPCILIKMNRIFNWKPETFTANDLPSKASDELKRITQMQNVTEDGPLIWLTCEGENPADKENIGTVNYYPYPGFAAMYFPYTNVQGYLSPFVFANFPNIEKGVLVNIECRAWAKNIKHGRQERKGSVHFELMVD